MNNLMKTVITLTAIGVAVKEIKKLNFNQDILKARIVTNESIINQIIKGQIEIKSKIN